MLFEVLSPSEQLASHLRDQLFAGRWLKELPGTPSLSAQLGVDRKTIMAAMKILEAEGLLESQGAGRPRRITLPRKASGKQLKVHFIPYEQNDLQRDFVIDLLNEIRAAGHSVTASKKSLISMGMNVDRVAKYVSEHSANAWLTLAASREVLEWFAALDQPAFALFGRRRMVPIASVGPNKEAAMRAAVRRLVDLGHRRIVLMAREERRKPSPGHIERMFLSELKRHDINPGPYNLPEWQDNPSSFHECLDSLFKHTPPTALILDEAQFFVAAQQHLASSDLVAPRDVSLMCSDTHPLFDWCRPAISHISWDSRPVVNRILRWVNQLTRGKNERKTYYTPAEFVEGGTIGPVPK